MQNNINIRQTKVSHSNQLKIWNRLLFVFSFLMAFPSLLLLGQNASIVLFGLISLFIVLNSRSSILGLTQPLQWLALFFGLGAIASVGNIPEDASANALERAMAVLPNYLYWALLIIILVQHRRLINLEIVYHAVFWGVICTVIYYLFLQQILGILPFFNRQTPNNFAFILICYSPIAVYYLKMQKNKNWALVFLSLLVLILLRDGRRAGMVLVLLGGLAVLYADRTDWKRLVAVAVATPVFLFTLFSSPVESFILQSSERIHEMIYQTEKIQKEDRSYLTRVAMVKKGLAIFEQYPYTGVGLNNFTNFSIDFDKSFEGAKYVVNKNDVQRTSSHNSYINILAEGGLFLFIPLILILLINIIHLFKNYNKLQDQLPIYIGVITMCIHLYFISAIVNVYAWFLIGICAALTSSRK